MGTRRVRTRIFNGLARVTGVLWVIGGTLGALSATRATEDRALAIGVAVFFALAGIGLLVARPATGEEFDRLAGRRPRKDSTDQRGPDEWQA